jgi:hypothetical protein
MKTFLFGFGAMLLAANMALPADMIIRDERPGPVIEEHEAAPLEEGTDVPMTKRHAKELREMWEYRAKRAATPEERAHAREMRGYYEDLEHHMKD